MIFPRKKFKILEVICQKTQKFAARAIKPLTTSLFTLFFGRLYKYISNTIKENRKGEYIRSKRTRIFWMEWSRGLVFGSNKPYRSKDCSWHKKPGSTGPVWPKSRKTVFQCAPRMPSLIYTHTLSFKVKWKTQACPASGKFEYWP